MKTVNAYQFNELPEAIQEKVLNDFNADPLYYHDPIIEGMTEDLESIGLEDIDIQYSGFWSQGDGLSFTAEVRDTNLFLEHIGAPRLSEDLLDALDISFWRVSHTTCHERSCSSSVDYVFLTSETQAEWDSNINHITQLIEDWRLKKCQSMYKVLERHYDECTTRDAVIDHFEANEYYFLEDGHMLR
jgi:hypothetical protein